MNYRTANATFGECDEVPEQDVELSRKIERPVHLRATRGVFVLRVRGCTHVTDVRFAPSQAFSSQFSGREKRVRARLEYASEGPYSRGPGFRERFWLDWRVSSEDVKVK